MISTPTAVPLILILPAVASNLAVLLSTPITLITESPPLVTLMLASSILLIDVGTTPIFDHDHGAVLAALAILPQDDITTGLLLIAMLLLFKSKSIRLLRTI